MKKVKFLNLLLLVMLVCSCEKDKDAPTDTPVTPEAPSDNPVTPESAISVDPSSLVLSSLGESRSLNVVASGKWTVSGSVPWLQVSPTSGEGNATVTIIPEANPDAVERNATLTFVCGDATAQLTVTQIQKNAEMVSPDYVPIDWTKCQVEKADTVNNIYSIRANGAESLLSPGSVIVIDGQVKIVKTISTVGGVSAITAENGDICNIFHDVEFTLATSSEAAVGTKAGGHPVFYPSKITYCNPQGEYVTLSVGQTRATTFTHDLWTWGKDLSGTTLLSGNNWRIFCESAYYKLDIDAAISLSFGERTLIATATSAIQQYKSNTMWIDASIVGTFDADALLKFEALGSFNYQQEEDEMFIHNVFKPVRMEFNVYGVPVELTLSSDMFRGVYARGEGRVEMSAGAHDVATGRLGLRWTQSSGSLSPYQDFANTFTFHMPNTQGKGSVEGKCWVYPRVKLLLYGVLGPSFDFKPYQKVGLAGGYSQTLGGSPNDYLAWSLRTYSGVDAAVGLSVNYMNYEVKNLSSPDFNIVESLLYESPYGIVNVSSVEKFPAGKKGTATFEVKDWDNISKREVNTPLPQVVRFEAQGTLSREYAFCSSGRVSVDWTPKNGDDKLYARLYAKDGRVLGEAVVEAEAEHGECPDQHHPHAIDLGLSVKWACCNVGAGSPSEYGDYFAWGETTPKSKYNDTNYKYFISDSNGWLDRITKYNTESHYGPVDNRTRLELSDDAARQQWGGSWRMPTREEFQELEDKCWWRWDTEGGHWGYRVTGPNGNSIFLPAAGWRDGSSLYSAGGSGHYWSSSLSASRSHNASYLYFSSYHNVSNFSRGYGQSVRSVTELPRDSIHSIHLRSCLNFIEK